MTNEQAPAIGETPATPAQYVIRAATAEDATGVAEAHVASWQTAYRGLLPQALPDGLPVERRTVQWQRGTSRTATSTSTSPPTGRARWRVHRHRSQ